MKEAEAAVPSRRDEAGRVRREIERPPTKNDRLVRLLVDPDIGQGTKKVLSRQIADTEAKRESLQDGLGKLDVQAAGETQMPAGAMRRAQAESPRALRLRRCTGRTAPLRGGLSETGDVAKPLPKFGQQTKTPRRVASASRVNRRVA